MINDVKVDEIELTRSATQHTIRLPRSALRNENMKVRFVVLARLQPEPPAAESAASSSAVTARSGRGRAGQIASVSVPAKPLTPEAQKALDVMSLGIKLIDIKLVDPDAPVVQQPVAGALPGALKG